MGIIQEYKREKGSLLRNSQLPEVDTSFIETPVGEWRKSARSGERSQRANRYLAGGVIAADLLLIQMVIQPGTLAPSSLVALFALIVSLPLAGGALFLSCLTSENGMTVYAKIDNAVSGLSVYATVVLVAALLWHVSPTGSVIFLCLVAVMSLVCVGCATGIAVRKHSVSRSEESLFDALTSDNFHP